MNQTTIERLNALNRQFYETTATAFDATRQQPWQGWQQLVPHVPDVRPLRVMDVGCGNGRFALYLRQQITGAITYLGIDSNQALLSAAQSALAAMKDCQLTYMQRDIVQDGIPTAPFDLVVLFGVIHHVPGRANRLRLLRELAQCVAPGGILAFAAWRFMDNDRLRKKVVDWLPDLEREDGDYLLDWRRGETAIRYCHYVDDAEHAALIAATGLREVLTYRADGHDNQTNQYTILR